MIAFGVFEVLKPRPVIAACERIGIENPGDARLRTRAVELARLEGLLVVWLLVRGRRRARLSSTILLVGGVVAALAPRPLIRLSQSFAYENPTDLRLEPWVVPAARALGVLYLAVVFLAGTADAEDGEAGLDASAETGPVTR